MEGRLIADRKKICFLITLFVINLFQRKQEFVRFKQMKNESKKYREN